MSSDREIPKTFFWAVPLVALFAGLAALIISRAESSRSELPVFGKVPDFEFVERSGVPFGLDKLQGQVVVFDFIFTRCRGICPIMATGFIDLYSFSSASDRVRLVSITVDPDYDSLEVLQRYATQHGVSDNRWVFLRAPIEKVASLMEGGFKLAADDLPAGHPSKFILVDGEGQIRGYYSSGDEASLTALKTHIRELVRSM